MIGNIVISIIFFLGQELLFLRENYFWWIVACLSIIFLVFLFRLVKTKIDYLILPLFFYIGALSFLTLLPNNSLRHFYIVISSLILFFLLELTRRKVLFKTEEAKERFSSYDLIVLTAAFLGFSSFFGFYLYLNLPFWLFLLFVLVFSFFLGLAYFSWYGFARKGLLASAVLSLVILEFTWALTFWPSGIITRSVVLLALFYVFLGLEKNYLLEKKINKRLVFDYLIISLVVLGVVLGTSKWFF